MKLHQHWTIEDFQKLRANWQNQNNGEIDFEEIEFDEEEFEQENFDLDDVDFGDIDLDYSETEDTTPTIDKEDFVYVFEEEWQKCKEKQSALKMLILGHPGSGKTTLMKWIALQCHPTKEGIFGGLLPVFISLKDLVNNSVNDFRKCNLREWACAQFRLQKHSNRFFGGCFAAGQGLVFVGWIGRSGAGRHPQRGDSVD